MIVGILKYSSFQQTFVAIQDLGEKIKKQCYTNIVKVATGQKLQIKKEVFVMDTKMMEQFEIMDTEGLEIVGGGGGNIGSAIGGCIGAVLLAAAAGPITGGAATLICVGSGIMSSL